jgi:hypothetical protein
MYRVTFWWGDGGTEGVVIVKSKQYRQTQVLFLRVSFVRLHVWKSEPVPLSFTESNLFLYTAERVTTCPQWINGQREAIVYYVRPVLYFRQYFFIKIWASKFTKHLIFYVGLVITFRENFMIWGCDSGDWVLGSSVSTVTGQCFGWSRSSFPNSVRSYLYPPKRPH